MIRWLRVVLPGLSFLATFAVVYGLAAGVALYDEHSIRLLPETRKVTRAILGVASVVYALWRGTAFHPLSQPGYLAWLAATPWTSRKPLPLGPIHLVAQDVVIAGSVVLLAWSCGDGWALFVPRLFLLVYLEILAISLCLAGVWPWGYALFFLLSAAVWQWRDVQVCLAVEALGYAVAWLGLRREMARFPWESTWVADFYGRGGFTASLESKNRDMAGWPFGKLGPKFPGRPIVIPLHHALLIGLVVGAWVFALMSHIPTMNGPDRQGLYAMSLPVLLFAPLIRVAVYCEGYWQPISFWGRLMTGRWIIPGYDQVLVAPLLALAIGSLFLALAASHELEPSMTAAVVTAMTLFICLGLGPSLRAWRLTGHHRITDGGQKAGGVKVG